MTMDSEDMLASLLAQAAEEGADIATLRAVVEEAGDLGAGRALARIASTKRWRVMLTQLLSTLKTLFSRVIKPKPAPLHSAGWRIAAMRVLVSGSIARERRTDALILRPWRFLVARRTL